MSIRNTVIMLLVLLGLGSFWYIHDYKGEEERKEAKIQEERVFPNVKSENIQEVCWKQSQGLEDGTRTLARENGLWMISVDGQHKFIADTNEMNRTAEQIASLSRASVIVEDPKPEEYANFSLDKPYAELEVTVKEAEGQEAKKLVLQVGEETPAGDARYMRVKDQKPILEVNGGFMAFLQGRILDMRSKSALVVPPDQVKKIALRQADDSEICLERVANAGEGTDNSEVTTAKTKWELSKPEKSRADLNAVNDYLWMISGITVEQFIPAVEKPLLGNRNALWEITFGDNHTISVELWDDSDNKGKGNFFMRRPDTDEYMIVHYNGERNKLYPKQVADFEDHHVLDIAVDDICKMEINIPERQVAGKTEKARELVATKSRDSWKISKPEQTIEDENKRDAAVFEVAYSFVDLQWKERLANGEDKVIAAEPVASVYGDKDKLLGRIYLGDKDNGCYLRLEGQKEIYALESDPRSAWTNSIRTIIGEDKKDTGKESETHKDSDGAKGDGQPVK